MRRYRFHVPDLTGSVVTVTGAEAKHASAVLRLNSGEEVELFDGQGYEATGIVQSISSESMTVLIVSRLTKPESPIEAATLILATATPKGARADWMIEKCAELGVAEIRPLLFARSVVDPGGGKLDRWRRLAVAAAKQCGATRTMNIAEPVRLDVFLAGLGRSHCLYGMPDAQTNLMDELMKVSRGGSRFDPIVVVVGPEGGMTDEELVALQRSGGTPVSWAQNVLRIETAAVAATAVFATISAGCSLGDDTSRQ